MDATVSYGLDYNCMVKSVFSFVGTQPTRLTFFHLQKLTTMHKGGSRYLGFSFQAIQAHSAASLQHFEQSLWHL